jgi:hypothetical protein
MNRSRAILSLGVLALAVGSVSAPARQLIDESLSQWEIFMGVPHESVNVPGFPPSTSKDGTTGTPLGLGKDPLKDFRFDPTGDFYSGVGYARHAPSHEVPHGEWNTLEIYTLGGAAVHLVNGKPVMVVFNTHQNAPKGGGHVPLRRGKIQVQSEAAEVFYRDMRATAMDAFPDFLAPIVRKPETKPLPFPR